MKPLGPYLKARRRAAGLTFRQLAEKSGVNRSLLCRFEQGRYSPRLEQLEAIARALGFVVSVAWKRRVNRA